MIYLTVKGTPVQSHKRDNEISFGEFQTHWAYRRSLKVRTGRCSPLMQQIRTISMFSRQRLTLGFVNRLLIVIGGLPSIWTLPLSTLIIPILLEISKGTRALEACLTQIHKHVGICRLCHGILWLCRTMEQTSLERR